MTRIQIPVGSKVSLLATVGVICLLVPMLAKATVVSGEARTAPPKDAEEIVKNIRAIVDHGDLADEEFLSEKLGLTMTSGPIDDAMEPDFSCGLGVSSERNRIIEQRFSYASVPWYFTGWFGRNRVCDRPYVKVYLPNGLIEVVATIMVDFKKVCVKEGDIKKYFKSATYTIERGGFRVRYSVDGRNAVSIEIASPSSSPECAVYVNFYQNKL